MLLAYNLDLFFAGRAGGIVKQLVVRCPYRYTQNPIYLAGMAILLGWVIVYGSMAVLIGGAALWGSATRLVAPPVERALEARLGSAYLRD